MPVVHCKVAFSLPTRIVFLPDGHISSWNLGVLLGFLCPCLASDLNPGLVLWTVFGY
uniref:Uncharacterized protein n=1 Tax=Arundo donax TaxID=35708 RepID=A0A0A8YFL6_ARUDO